MKEMQKLVNEIKKTFALRVLTNLESRIIPLDDVFDVQALLVIIKDEVEQGAYDLTGNELDTGEEI